MPPKTLHGEAQAIRDRLALSMTEKRLQANVVALAKLLGARVYHTHDSRRSEPGFPDLCIAFTGPPKRILFVELKAERGKLTDDQAAWCLLLGAQVWRPRDWVYGYIERVLREPA